MAKSQRTQTWNALVYEIFKRKHIINPNHFRATYFRLSNLTKVPNQAYKTHNPCRGKKFSRLSSDHVNVLQPSRSFRLSRVHLALSCWSLWKYRVSWISWSRHLTWQFLLECLQEGSLIDGLSPPMTPANVDIFFTQLVYIGPVIDLRTFLKHPSTACSSCLNHSNPTPKKNKYHKNQKEQCEDEKIWDDSYLDRCCWTS